MLNKLKILEPASDGLINASGSPEKIQYSIGQVLNRALSINFGSILIAFTILATINTGCKNDNDDNGTDKSYQQVDLVANTASYGASRVDGNLTNPWGIAISPTGIFWISANHAGVSTVYDGDGKQALAPVTVPGGAPTGVVYNNTTDFKIPSNNETSKYIYAGEDGTISAWSSGTAAVMVADRSASGAVYKGIAIAKDGSDNFLYVANFKGNNIDVFDKSFNYITTKPFDDPSIPEGFAPFNIWAYDDQLFVTYAKLKGPDNEDDESGAGNGYINIFKPDGSLVKRFASQGTLNSPWGLVEAPTDFGQGSDRILVGNFGDGRINVFDEDGNYKGQLMDNGTPITIDGLWAIMFAEEEVSSLDHNKLYFTAGPNNEANGLFGYLKLK